MTCKMPEVLSLLFFISFLLLMGAPTIRSDEGDCSLRNHFGGNNIGAIVDYSSRIGKEAKTAIEMAVEDFHGYSGHKLLLHMRDSHLNPLQVASSVVGLIVEQQVQAVVGSLTWQEAAMIGNASAKAKYVPILSFVASAPTHQTRIPTRRRTPVIQVATDISSQMKCMAAIIGSYGWRRVIALYEDNFYDEYSSGIINHLYDSLRAVGSEVEHRLALPNVEFILDPKSVILEELRKLRNRQCKVFVLVQSSLPMAVRLFSAAKQLGMMSEGYIWIVNDDMFSLLDSVGSTIISSSMQGMIGIKTHFSESTQPFEDFHVRFRRRFRSEYPEEANQEPSIYTLRAYDAVWAVARAMKNISSTEMMNSNEELFKDIISSDFMGVSGKIQFKHGGLEAKPAFRIVNVVGKSYREIGFWSEKLGFYDQCEVEGGDEDHKSGGGNRNMDLLLGPVYWPGGPRQIPRGWMVMPSGSGGEGALPLRVAVPARGAFNQFVKVRLNGGVNGSTLISGFSVEVFEAVVKRLPYHLPYEPVPFYGTYDEMVEQVHLKTFDAAVGDIGIMAKRYLHTDFTQPYMESGLVMVVTEKTHKYRKAWMFMEPFTVLMWLLTAAICAFTGFVVSVIERGVNNKEFGEDTSGQVGILLWFSFSTLFFAHREALRSNLSRLVVVTWLFVVLILTSSFTATLTSTLTVSRLKPSVVDVEALKRSNAMVGCNRNSFIVRHLVEVLGFSPTNIMRIGSIDEYPEALLTGKIAAAFLCRPQAKVFLSEYCHGFTIAGATYRLGGLGFVFPKGSPLALDFSEAILQATENGEIQRLETTLLSSTKCMRLQGDTGVDGNRLGPDTFWGLFLISGGVSAAALIISLATRNGRSWHLDFSILEMLVGKGILRWVLGFLKPKHTCSSNISLDFGSEANERPSVLDEAPHVMTLQVSFHHPVSSAG